MVLMNGYKLKRLVTDREREPLGEAKRERRARDARPEEGRLVNGERLHARTT